MIKLIKEVKLWNNGYCQMWDFSEANASEANRIEAVTTVANVCRGDKGVKNPKELYQQLLTEHDGKCGSVFEFVPATIETGGMRYKITEGGVVEPMSVAKHGIKCNFTQLTNLRSLLEDGMNDYNTMTCNPVARDLYFILETVTEFTPSAASTKFTIAIDCELSNS